jgi:hypothetical protein
VRFLSIRLLATITFIIVIFIVLLIHFFPKYKKIIIIGIFTVCFITITSQAMYLLNPQFKQFIDFKFNNSTEYTYVINNQTRKVPLPPKTIFLYRTSEIQAVYLTNVSEQEVVDFYFSMADSNVLKKNIEKQSTQLLFDYNESSFSVTCEPSKNNIKLFIETIQ